MNEEENSDTFKLGAKEYDAPTSVIPKFLFVEYLSDNANYANHSSFWDSMAQETFSPPPEHI